MLSMLVGMKDSNVKFLINDLAACQDKKTNSGLQRILSMGSHRNRGNSIMILILTHYADKKINFQE